MMLELHHEEDINKQVEVKSGKYVARIAVVPQEYLHWHNHSCVEQQSATDKKHPCHRSYTKLYANSQCALGWTELRQQIQVIILFI